MHLIWKMIICLQNEVVYQILHSLALIKVPTQVKLLRNFTKPVNQTTIETRKTTRRPSSLWYAKCFADTAKNRWKLSLQKTVELEFLDFTFKGSCLNVTCFFSVKFAFLRFIKSRTSHCKNPTIFFKQYTSWGSCKM